MESTLNLGRVDIIFGGMSVTKKRRQQVDFANPFMTVGQTILLGKQHQALVKSYRDLNDPKYTVISKPATTGEAAVRIVAGYRSGRCPVGCFWSTAPDRRTPIKSTRRPCD